MCVRYAGKTDESSESSAESPHSPECVDTTPPCVVATTPPCVVAGPPCQQGTPPLYPAVPLCPAVSSCPVIPTMDDEQPGNDTTVSVEGDPSCWPSQWVQEDEPQEQSSTEVEEWEQEVFDP